MASANILVVDDKEAVLALFKDTLEDLGHTVYCADTAETGLEEINGDFTQAYHYSPFVARQQI